MKNKTEIIQLLEPILREKNLFLVEITVSPDSVIEVYIDSFEGINISSCISVSKALEELLDRENGDFELNVFSAGIGYPFKVSQQYEKNLGKTVEVKKNDGKKIKGILKAHDGQGIILEIEEKTAQPGKKKKEIIHRDMEIPFTEIKEVKDIIIF